MSYSENAKQAIRTERFIPIPVADNTNEVPITPKYQQISERLDQLYKTLTSLESLVERIKDQDQPEQGQKELSPKATFYTVYSSLPYQLENITARLDNLEESIEELIYR